MVKINRALLFIFSLAAAQGAHASSFARCGFSGTVRYVAPLTFTWAAYSLSNKYSAPLFLSRLPRPTYNYMLPSTTSIFNEMQKKHACATPLVKKIVSPEAQKKATEAMFTATQVGDLEGFQNAVANGADTRAKDAQGYTALEWAEWTDGFDYAQKAVNNTWVRLPAAIAGARYIPNMPPAVIGVLEQNKSKSRAQLLILIQQRQKNLATIAELLKKQ